MQTEIFLDDKQISKILAKSPQSLRNERQQGRGLPYYKIGKSVRYKLSEVLEILERCRIEPEKVRKE
jgi:hypothetical protein